MSYSEPAEVTIGPPPVLPTVADVQAVLDERGTQYGDFEHQAAIVQHLKDAMREHPGWRNLRAYHQEALEMIVHKIGRIVNGNPDYADSWVDIAGYAQLVVRSIEKTPRNKA